MLIVCSTLLSECIPLSNNVFCCFLYPLSKMWSAVQYSIYAILPPDIFTLYFSWHIKKNYVPLLSSGQSTVPQYEMWLFSRVIWLQHIGWVAMGTDSDATVKGLMMPCRFQTFSILIWFCSDTICLTVHENLVTAFSVSQAYLVLPVCNVFDLIHQDYPVNANTKHFSSCLQCHLIYNSFHSFILSLIE